MEHGHEKIAQLGKNKWITEALTEWKVSREMQLESRKTAIKHIYTESWQCRHWTLTLIGSTRRQSHRKTRETQQAYCTSPGDMKGTVINGLVLSLIILQHFRERWKTKQKKRQWQTQTHHGHLIGWKRRSRVLGYFNSWQNHCGFNKYYSTYVLLHLQQDSWIGHIVLTSIKIRSLRGSCIIDWLLYVLIF